MASVTYIPNDPLASGGPAPRQVRLRTRAPSTVGFDISPDAPAGAYQPHTAGFDRWQAYQALTLGVQAWRELEGADPGPWYGNRLNLPVLTDAGDDLNAFYDRRGLQFFHHTYQGKTVHSSESVDVVCHEEGHALLDAIRPDFFDVPFIEVGALHEAFGDCMAILSGLTDATVRSALLGISADLSGNNFLESLAEELGDAIRREYGAASVESGALRHALNAFRWVDPTSLPPNAPADRIAAEVHSFSRVFTGAFWDTIRGIQAARPRTATGLRRAVRTAGRLLLAALRTVPAAPRTFEGVGRRMADADASLNAGANIAVIRAAFDGHGLSIPAPAVALPEPIPGGRTRAGATRHLRGQLEVPAGARLRFTAAGSDLHGEVAHVTAYRPVALTDELAGLHIMVPATARVRTRGAAIVGILGDVSPADAPAEVEARAFARALLANGDLTREEAAGPRRLRGATMAPMALPPPRPVNAPFPPTHAVRTIDGLATIVRIGFA